MMLLKLYVENSELYEKYLDAAVTQMAK